MESLFISDKLQLLLSSNIKTLELFYFTYPIISQIASLPAAIINPVLAPIITSGIALAFMAAFVVVRFYDLKLRTLSAVTSFYFLTSPVAIGIATSGTSLYLYLIFYFIFFYLLFRYLRDFTTYNFVLLSICLTLFVFLDASFLWIIVFMIPIILFFSLYNTRYKSMSYVGIFSELTQNTFERKELIGRSLSTVLVIVFTPIMSLLFYLIINYWFTGDILFFTRTGTTQWNQHEFLQKVFYQFDLATITQLNQTYFPLAILFMSPLFLFVMFHGRRKILFQSIVALVPIWLLFSKNTDYSNLLSLSTLLIITAAGIAGFLHLFQTKLFHKFISVKFFNLRCILILGVSIAGEFAYLHHTQNPIEQNMLAFYIQKEPINIKSSDQLASFILKNIPEDARILADNTVFFPSMALIRAQHTFLDQFQEGFYEALQAPNLYADYIIVSKKETQAYPKDKLKPVIENLRLNADLKYSNEHFRLLKIK
ncbi:hypothetical protein [Christiangramia sp. LLG6405-1]|uniref:hypothetical protein n=1 Tax=Christiangramia sp. LLG6405-1 TaxID=3160832 RepID=UPI00386E0E28